MPTWEASNRFWADYAKLPSEQKGEFHRSRREFIQRLVEWEEGGCRGLPKFPARLGVKQMVNRRQIAELAWDQDGRCTWQFGALRVLDGKCHVIWRRIGTHDIYEDP